MSYINQFLELKCSPDVLGSVYPVIGLEKEISESMAIIKRIKKVLVCSPDTYTVFDLCAGNCLTSSIIAHLFKVKHVYAIDKANRVRDGFSRIKNFSYTILDIVQSKSEIVNLMMKSNPCIVISSHPCCDLAQEIIKIYKSGWGSYLVMIPCCHGRLIENYPSFLSEKLSKYEMWCLDLCNMCNGNAYIDKKCLSEKNIVIVASTISGHEVMEDEDLNEKE